MRLQAGLAMALLLCALGFGAGLVLLRTPDENHAAPPQSQAKKSEARNPDSLPGDKKETTGRDRFGDPLPPGVIARMGTIRFHHGNIITGVSYSPDGKRLVSTSPKELKVWDAQTGAELRQISDFKASAFPSVVSPDHRFVAVSHADDGIKLLDLGSSRDRLIVSPAEIHLKKTGLDAASEAISPSIAFSPDSKLLAGADWDGFLGLWDTHTGEPVRTLRRSSSSPSHIAFSPDGKTIAFTHKDETICLCTAETGAELKRFEISASQKQGAGGFSHLAFFPRRQDAGGAQVRPRGI